MMHLDKFETDSPVEEGELPTERRNTLSLKSFQGTWPVLQLDATTPETCFNAQLTLEDILINRCVRLRSVDGTVKCSLMWQCSVPNPKFLLAFWQTSKACKAWLKRWTKRNKDKIDTNEKGCIHFKPEFKKFIKRKGRNRNSETEIRPQVHVTSNQTGKKGMVMLTHAVLFAKRNESLYSCPLLTKGTLAASEIDLSHLCHNGGCFNADHLVLEPATVNLDRNTCESIENCRGHGEYKNCIL